MVRREGEDEEKKRQKSWGTIIPKKGDVRERKEENLTDDVRNLTGYLAARFAPAFIAGILLIGP